MSFNTHNDLFKIMIDSKLTETYYFNLFKYHIQFIYYYIHFQKKPTLIFYNIF